ncbi:MAG: DUF1934 domain-containing protein [Oscillospiraceae bacterium]|nr:DUF1934 domain-containing protein [Oscillospiraceae bacterium]
MKKDIIIKIIDIHDTRGRREGSELITVGQFAGDRENYSLTYTERNQELEACETTLIVEGQERVVMTRRGPFTTEMIMEKHKRHSCHYETPYGDFMLGVCANTIDSDVDGQSGRLRFRYTVDVDSANAMMNELDISFKETGKEEKRFEK